MFQDTPKNVGEEVRSLLSVSIRRRIAILGVVNDALTFVPGKSHSSRSFLPEHRQTAVSSSVNFPSDERPSSAAAAAPVRYELPETNKAAAVCFSVWFGSGLPNPLTLDTLLYLGFPRLVPIPRFDAFRRHGADIAR